MKPKLEIVQSLHGILLLCATLVTRVDALEYQVSIPDYQANSGQALRVPVSLNDACGLAHVRLQINYNNQIAELTAVSPAPLGEHFDLTSTIGDGLVTIDAVRAESLACGSGAFVWLDFQLNAGATTDNYSDLAVAVFEGADDSGVIDLSVTNNFIAVNGSITLTLEQNIDNSGNQLPDWWETAQGLDPYTALADGDDEQDGLTNLIEYALGSDPTKNDAATMRPQWSLDASKYAYFSFRRRTDDSLLIFQVQESFDLQQWNEVDLNSHMVGDPVQLDGHLEQITIRSQHPLGEIESPERLFMRLEVLR
jgi:hypothetical protein